MQSEGENMNELTKEQIIIDRLLRRIGELELQNAILVSEIALANQEKEGE